MAETTRLPSGWAETTLGTLGTFYRGHGGTREDEMPHGLPCVRYGDLYTHHGFIIRSFASFIKPTRASSYFPLKPGDIVFAASGETFEEIGKAAVYCDQAPAFAGGDTIIFRPLPQLDPCFAGYAVNGLIANRHKARHGQGSSVIHIGTGHLAALPIALPPHRVQQRIAHCLQTIDQAIEKTEALIEKYQQIKAGLMHDLFTRGIGPDGKLRPPREQAPELYQETPIGWIPREWSTKLGKDCFFLCSGTTPVKIDDFGEGDFLYLKVEDFNSPRNHRGIVTAKSTFSDTPANRHAISHSIPEGCVIFPKRGAAIFKNRAQILKRQANIDPNLMAAQPRCHVESFLARYLTYFDLSNICDNSGLPQINNKHLYPLILPVPSMVEQEAIMKIADSADDLMDQEKIKLEKTVCNKAGLMHDLLTGKVPVNPDPTEPADA